MSDWGMSGPGVVWDVQVNYETLTREQVVRLLEHPDPVVHKGRLILMGRAAEFDTTAGFWDKGTADRLAAFLQSELKDKIVVVLRRELERTGE